MSASRSLRTGVWTAGVTLCLLLLGSVAHALVDVPKLVTRVTDLTSTLDAGQKQTLEQTLAAFEARKGAQIAVLIVPTTQPEAIEQYSIRVVEQWKLGRAKPDDGVLLLVAKDDRTIRIEVGYGLEGALTDATANRIIQEVIVPQFRAGDYSGGIAAGVDRIIRVVDGEALPAPPAQDSRAVRGFEPVLPIVLMIALVGGSILRRMFGRVGGAVTTSALVGGIVWFIVSVLGVAVIAAVIAFFITLLGGGGGGGWASSPRGRRGGWTSGG
ncbi:MAG: YgcG family protein, partial [Steroidobacteraceae bacterium]